MKIGLGTVQFGLDYGISNEGGKTPLSEVKDIIKTAGELGVRVVDTASLYGNSEEALGLALTATSRFDIVTKTPQFAKDCIESDDVLRLEEIFRQSLAKLRRPSAYGLLVHRVDDVLVTNGNLLMEKMQELKKLGFVKKVGVSVYSAQQIDRVLDQYQIDIIQLPINVLDQRLLRSGHLQKLKRAGVEIHARSAFLQGLLLMDPKSLPPHFDGVRDHLESWRKYSSERGMTPLQGALGFAISIPEIDCVICGVNNHQQLQEICAASQLGLEWRDCAQFAVEDELILNPTNWRTIQ